MILFKLRALIAGRSCSLRAFIVGNCSISRISTTLRNRALLLHNSGSSGSSSSSDNNDRQHASHASAFSLSSMLLAILFSWQIRAIVDKQHVHCEEESKSEPTAGLQPEIDDIGVSLETEQTITNWSSTHTCHPKAIYQPQSAQEVSRVLQMMSSRREKIRPVGTALSPNGIGMSSHNLLSVANIDFIEVDKEKRTVTVGAGATVTAILKELAKHGLTLENFSSIQEQQMAGWTQVSAHGTGCTLSTVDSMITRMKLATPSNGILTLSPQSNRLLFDMAKVGLGSLGVVTELTLTCIPQFDLKETSFSTTTKDIAKGHSARLADYRHVRHMWVPYTDTVVVVVSNPCDKGTETVSEGEAKNTKATQPLVDLLLTIEPSFPRNKADLLSFSQLRDMLLEAGPLDMDLVRRINGAEAAYWSAFSGVRVADSTDILGFECGGEQFVYEVCFPIGSLKQNTKSQKDLNFVKSLLAIIEQADIPAPSPIEQRWSARSTSPMSPAFSTNPDDVFCWVGVIMYLPANQSQQQRKEIRKVFRKYKDTMQPLVEQYNGQCHWAKVELPLLTDRNTYNTANDSISTDLTSESNETIDWEEMSKMRTRVWRGFPMIYEFNAYRKVLDPHKTLSNKLIDELFAEESL